MLPDRSVTIFKIKRFSTADKVYEVNLNLSLLVFSFLNKINL